MARYDRGYDARGGYRGPNWYRGFGRSGSRGYRGARGDRSGTGGYRPGYPGGSGGIPAPGPRLSGYGDDYWWLGEHELRRRGAIGPYDRGYQEFDRQSHPRYSPIGGTYPAMGGRYAYHRPPRPLREDTWFSDWTRWF